MAVSPTLSIFGHIHEYYEQELAHFNSLKAANGSIILAGA